MHKDAKFWDRFAARYARTAVADEDSYQKKLAKTREYLRPESRVLEFGCGTGTTAISHAPFAQHILGVDISPKMIEIAQGKAKDADVTNVAFQVGELGDAPPLTAGYDMVMGHSVLHLLRDKDAAIVRVFDLLKPGGTFVSSTTCLGDGLSFFKYVGMFGAATGLLPVLTVFRKQELEDSIKAAGFQIDHIWQPGPRKAVFIVAQKPV
ncbi:MAG: class I SAM-dependent DNA methyltransferase [Marinosulfonomonas sp.]